MQPVKKMFTAAITVAATGAVLFATASGAHAATGLSYLRQGSYGPGVACAQWAENSFLDPQPPNSFIVVDGDFGPATYNQTVWFQEQEGLSQDGIIGPRTGNKIMSEINLQMRYHGDQEIWNGYWLSDCYSHVPTSY